MNILLKLIQEEIDKACLDLENGIFFEQVAPPAAPTPPADPNAASSPEPSPEAESEDAGDDISKTIETLAKKTTTDITKTLLSDIQSGKREDVEKVVATVEAEENSQDKDIQQAIDKIRKVFKFKVPKKVEEEAKEKAKEKEGKNKETESSASAATAPAAGGSPPASPVTESKLQIALREYLFYKNLYEKEAAK